MEKGEVGEETELLRKKSGDVGVVNVDAGDDEEAAVGRKRSAVDALVGADVGSDPGSGDIRRIRDDRLLPRLESNVGVAEAGVREDQ